MVTGSPVSSLYGEPRSTHDIDLVVVPPPERIPACPGAYPPADYCPDEEAIREAVERRDMFDLIHLRSGDKVDFRMLTEEEFDRSRFARRQLEAFQGITLRVPTPEDALLAKLKRAHLAGGSEKQTTDALRIYEVQCPALDLEHAANRARRLGVEYLWTRLQQEAQIR
jgi:hypothetical protein